MKESLPYETIKLFCFLLFSSLLFSSLLFGLLLPSGANACVRCSGLTGSFQCVSSIYGGTGCAIIWEGPFYEICTQWGFCDSIPRPDGDSSNSCIERFSGSIASENGYRDPSAAERSLGNVFSSESTEKIVEMIVNALAHQGADALDGPFQGMVKNHSNDGEPERLEFFGEGLRDNDTLAVYIEFETRDLINTVQATLVASDAGDFEVSTIDSLDGDHFGFQSK